ncbi:unnamed protein product [Musa acuminata var. zebrina]
MVWIPLFKYYESKSQFGSKSQTPTCFVIQQGKSRRETGALGFEGRRRSFCFKWNPYWLHIFWHVLFTWLLDICSGYRSMFITATGMHLSLPIGRQNLCCCHLRLLLRNQIV